MNTNNPWGWRLANLEADLPMNAFLAIGLPYPSQFFPKSYTVKQSQGEGGTARHGYSNYQILWTKLTGAQARVLRDRFNTAMAGTKLLFVSGLWWDDTDGGERWVDIEGKPELSDMAYNPPSRTSTGMNTVSNVRLTLNDIRLVNDPATY